MPAVRLASLFSPLRRLLRRFGFDVVRVASRPDPNPDIDLEAREIFQEVRPFTMTSLERIVAAIEAVRYIERYQIPGGIAECGVWRGGSTMAMALALQRSNSVPRDFYPYDTFEGMTPPTSQDVDHRGFTASSFLESEDKSRSLVWAYCDLETVKQNLARTGYPEEKFHIIQGPVQETIPNPRAGELAILRVDIDWYELTKHVLVHLFPSLVERGVLILDDYGHWEGARRAVDDYLRETDTQLFLNRIDYSGRLAIKTEAP